MGSSVAVGVAGTADGVVVAYSERLGAAIAVVAEVLASSTDPTNAAAATRLAVAARTDLRRSFTLGRPKRRLLAPILDRHAPRTRPIHRPSRSSRRPATEPPGRLLAVHPAAIGLHGQTACVRTPGEAGSQVARSTQPSWAALREHQGARNAVRLPVLPHRCGRAALGPDLRRRLGGRDPRHLPAGTNAHPTPDRKSTRL